MLLSVQCSHIGLHHCPEGRRRGKKEEDGELGWVGGRKGSEDMGWSRGREE